MAGLSLAALRHRDFALYVTSSFLWTIAMSVQAFALAWQIYLMTGNEFLFGLVGLVEFLPAAVLALPAGHIADRYDRRRIILIGIVMELAAAGVLFLLAATDSVTVPAIFIIAFAFGVARAIANPAARAMMPSLVPKADLAGGVAWNSTSWQTAVICGPGLGGLLYAIGPAYAYGATVLTLAAALVSTIAMRGRRVERLHADQGSGTDLTQLLAGLTLIRRNKLLLGAISLDLFAVLFSSATALIVVFAQDILKVDVDWAAFLRTIQGIGAGITAAALTQLPLRRHVGARLFMAVGVFGVAAVLFGFSREYWLSALAVFVLGAADMVSVYVRGTLVPLATPDALRGRVVAVEAVFIGASNELGMFVAGSAAAILGPVAAVVAGGSLTLGVTLLWTRLFPALRNVDRFEDVHVP
jgi:MFS family permease